MARRHASRQSSVRIVAFGLAICLATMTSQALHAQPTAPVIDRAVESPSGQTPAPITPSSTSAPSFAPAAGLNLFDLMWKGGWAMVPIIIASLLAMAIVIERSITLRRERVLPAPLFQDLLNFGDSFDPRSAYRVCQRYPSPAATVLRTMLLKVGRPHSEVERAIADASEREANKLYDNVRWLNLIAAVAPLLGLLGTVWGMIQAFYVTTQLQPGQNKADFLASGIYVALVTTLGGLIVAIPAAIFAHHFEGRIQTLFHQLEESIFQLLPHIEPYEGRVRVTSQGKDIKAVSNGKDANKPTPVPK